ncbi:MAG: TIGR02147 family protein [Deltaproteobacteria bacterium]|nr:TIGR02147 family protein [Deltaproteobacteria bacterium]
MASATEPDVFSFLDYREYLRAYYRFMKQQRGLSYRAFARRAKLQSPNYLKLVIDGERNLTKKMARRFAAACDLRDEAALYFQLLVGFNQAHSVDERNRWYRRLKRMRRYQDTHFLDQAYDVYHSLWYLPAIREFVASVEFREDYSWIARRLAPPIKASEAEMAVQTLLKLGLLERDKRGRLRRKDATVSTGSEVYSLHLANYHRAMLSHAKSSLDRIEAGQRDISSVTLCLDESGINRVKQALQRFRRELLDIDELEERPKQVIQVNFQLFPLTTIADIEVES